MKKLILVSSAVLLGLSTFAQSISSVSPNSANTGTWSLPVSISGTNTNFTAATSTVVKVTQNSQQLEVLNVNNVTSTTVDFDVRISNLSPLGNYNVEVYDSNVGDMVTLNNGFYVGPNTAPPALMSTAPETGAINQILPVTITTENTHFSQATDNTIYLTQGTFTILPVGNSVQVLNDNHIKALFDFSNPNISIGNVLSSHCGNSFDGYFSDNLTITVTPITSINGTIIYGGVYNGVVELYQKNTNVTPNTYSLIATAAVNSSNQYDFTVAAEATYLLRSVPINMSDVVATYYTDVIDWINATEVNTALSSTNTADITPFQSINLSGGTTVNGTLGYGPNGFTKAPIVFAEGVEVFLRDVDNNTYAQSTTDANGFFEFAYVPLGNYDIVIDLPGYNQVSTYTFSVTQSGQMLEDLDFLIDNDEIFKSGFMSVKDYDYTEINIFPNPTNGLFFVELPEFLNQVELNIFNQQGQLVYTDNNANNTTTFFEVDLSELTSGMYIGRLTSGTKVIDFKVSLK
ncbi:T9SS type A sorting domain-containing protein [Paracrocinitomix mangrovi]|uniref:T9SS type A sorting domain-containing protein n=1 Tax=Paracrocinitomix mangrovi TaxID=2862509 RepID=UPI001C8D50D2|nr:T9SS type A sorting domain-containing protein [Paracrocinitomix mangrovi]UKN00621.1 T9SS type A sorting domain-containing protein [Paracrocinitomix mangrovi]